MRTPGRKTGRGRRSRLRRSRRRIRGSAEQGARARLRQFRQASIVAVAATGFLLLLVAPEEAGIAQQTVVAGDTAAAVAGDQLPDTVAVIEEVPVEALQAGGEVEVDVDSAAQDATEEATGTLRSLWQGFVGNLPKYAIALGILAVAWLLVRGLRLALPRLLGRWERASAVAAFAGVLVWIVALGIAMSVLVGDIRALVGSLGLVGLALSWALQTPIESFTGWLLNSFQGYYRVGDRIAVSDVFGDVYRIDFLTTTVWEYGGPDHPPGSIQAEQPTGRLITFPNNEVLTGTLINYTRDFPFVWDELTVAIANESQVTYAIGVLERLAREELGGYMEEPAHRYEALLQRVGLESSVPDKPQIYVSTTDWGTNLTIRYLVGAREKRKWKSQLSVRVLEELNRPEHQRKIISVYPRQQIQMVRADGVPADAEWMEKGGDGEERR